MEYQELPSDWNQGPTSIDLSKHRTQMSIHRTALSDARSNLANERTHLAYFRTSVSLMSFGITLNRFSIFLSQGKPSTAHHGFLFETELVGIGMVVLGIVILGWALYRYRTVSYEIEHDSYIAPKKAMTILTLAILFLGGLSAIWLFIRRA